MPEWKNLEEENQQETAGTGWDIIDAKDFDDTLLFGRQK